MSKHALKKALLRLEYKVLEKNTLNLSGSAWQWEFTVEERDELVRRQEEIAKKKALIIDKMKHLK